MAGIEGTGTILTFGTTGFSANLLSVGGPGLERQKIDNTHMGTTVARTSFPSTLYEVGEVDIEFEFNGDDSPPIDQPAEAITIDWAGQGAGFRDQFSGYMTNYNKTSAIGERMTATATLVGTGAITFAG